MENLSEKTYWNGVHKNNSVALKYLIKIPLIKNIVLGLQNWEFFNICKKYILPEYKSVFEIGCAPGNYLVNFYHLFGLIPNGIEYSEEGMYILQRNMLKNGIDSNIIFGDFFNEEFLKEHQGEYDVVYSMGFIEHFDDPQECIDNHFQITKSGGLVIITIPNLYHLNKYFVEKKILDIHNLKIMQIDLLISFFKKYHVLECRYFGGFFNIGGFAYKNWFLEKIRITLFVFQRLAIDPIFMIFWKLGINFSNKYTSPSIIIICKK